LYIVIEYKTYEILLLLVKQIVNIKKGTRTKLSLAEQKDKLEKDKLKIAELQAKVNIADLKNHI